MRAGTRASPPRRRGRAAAHTLGGRPDGLYIGEQPQPPHEPQAQQEEDDPELQAALAASREQQDLDELAKWPHLALFWAIFTQKKALYGL
ncbi:hypothetical protein QYE76_023593 [Lolium multiflorum]|uniref:Uncharacterized protein n=1 Tax=Lolium multiflorum TaxID=4521 RepID=A0AAD8RC18_LOLMU|nr:hypothetical protein QYE76_023593 [Lolium multiflorum]